MIYVIIGIIYFVAIIIIIVLKKQSDGPTQMERKGKAGENVVNFALKFSSIKEFHRTIHNLVLIDERGKTHQIDHIEIRSNGIFCVETKNIIGTIYGSEDQEHWVQVLYNSQKQLLNPLKQNNSHVYHVNRALNGKYHINSLVVFVQNNVSHLNIPNVINLNNLKSYLRNYSDGTYYSNKEIEDIYNTLLQANQTNVTHEQHVANIKQTQKELEQGICPRCGGQLIIRTGKYGRFIGCSNYPNCTFKKKISDEH